MAEAADRMGRGPQAAQDAPQQNDEQRRDQDDQNQHAGRGFQQPAAPFDGDRALLFGEPDRADYQDGELGDEPEAADHLAGAGADAAAAGGLPVPIRPIAILVSSASALFTA